MDRFPFFPTEIRLMIWQYAIDMAFEPLPPRVWPLAYRAPYLSIGINEFPLPKPNFAVFQVNQESRHEAVRRYLLFKIRDGPKRGRVRANIDVFIMDVGVLVEMACAPEWQLPHSRKNRAAVAWPLPLAAIYTSSWHNLASVRKILLPSACFTYLFRDKLKPLLGLPCLDTIYVDFGRPIRFSAQESAVEMFRTKLEQPGLAGARLCEFHVLYQEHSGLQIGPELKHSNGSDDMNERTKMLFQKWKRIFLQDVLSGWEPFAWKGVVGILVSDIQYGLQTEI
ncbi:hypothetical protein AAE478_010138 [Parahypoxylon ruwenzoriense]